MPQDRDARQRVEEVKCGAYPDNPPPSEESIALVRAEKAAKEAARWQSAQETAQAHAAAQAERVSQDEAYRRAKGVPRGATGWLAMLGGICVHCRKKVSMGARRCPHCHLNPHDSHAS
jgi:hypothetical protein